MFLILHIKRQFCHADPTKMHRPDHFMHLVVITPATFRFLCPMSYEDARLFKEGGSVENPMTVSTVLTLLLRFSRLALLISILASIVLDVYVRTLVSVLISIMTSTSDLSCLFRTLRPVFVLFLVSPQSSDRTKTQTYSRLFQSYPFQSKSPLRLKLQRRTIYICDVASTLPTVSPVLILYVQRRSICDQPSY